jgi:hypothetical protein
MFFVGMDDLGWDLENADEGGVDAIPIPSRTRRVASHVSPFATAL